MRLKKSEILRDCREWGACEHSEQFRYSLPDEIEISDAHTLGNSEYVAWYLFHAGLNWPDERYTPEIAAALCDIGNAWYLYKAGRDWPDNRYTAEIAETLWATGDQYCLYNAEFYWREEKRRKQLKH
jgi:hypothetical protein